MMAGKRCGTCRLWGENFSPAFINCCCADSHMDLPASWRNNNHMSWDQGEDCPIWQERHALPQKEAA